MEKKLEKNGDHIPEENESLDSKMEIVHYGNEFETKFMEACNKRRKAYQDLKNRSIKSKERLTHILRNTAGLATSATIDFLDPTNVFDLAIPGSQFLTDAMKDHLFGELQAGAVGLVAGKVNGKDFVNRDEATALGMALPIVSPATIEAGFRLVETVTGEEIANEKLKNIGKFFRNLTIRGIYHSIKNKFTNKGA